MTVAPRTRPERVRINCRVARYHCPPRRARSATAAAPPSPRTLQETFPLTAEPHPSPASESTSSILVAPYPLCFEPILKRRVWGGDRLARLGKRVTQGEQIGESWELADLDAPSERSDHTGNAVEETQTRIANGPLVGRTLRDILRSDQSWLMGYSDADTANGFPLLIKFLDAHENLSVQVHPSSAYAAEHPEAHIKSEAWVVLDAEPGAVIYRGFRRDVHPDTVRSSVADGTIVDLLDAVPARAGDCHYLPSGTCHALGAGVVVAEVQTPSDTTFRLYDWGRTGRTLHVDQALACMEFTAAAEQSSRQPVIEGDGITTEPLVDTPDFQIERLRISDRPNLPITLSNLPLVWIVLDGVGRISAPDTPTVPFRQGDTLLLPASLEGACAHFEKPTTILRVALPSPTRNVIA